MGKKTEKFLFWIWLLILIGDIGSAAMGREPSWFQVFCPLVAFTIELGCQAYL